MLASPAYGERWGRHWLDVVRFGESNGFERDLPRTNAWPYRDWVVEALNDDCRTTEFVRLQLAGDVLRPDDPAPWRPPAFSSPGRTTSSSRPASPMKQSMRQDELEDIVGTVGQTFLGLTVHCARCHDHKFDPVSAEGLLPPGRGAGRRPARRAAGHADRPAQHRRHRLQGQLRRAGSPPAKSPSRRQCSSPNGRRARPGHAAEAAGRVGLQRGPERSRRPAARQAKCRRGRVRIGLYVDGQIAFVATVPLAKDLREKTLEAWVRLDNLKQQRRRRDQRADDRRHSSSMPSSSASSEAGRWMAGSDGFARTRSFNGAAEKQAEQRGSVHFAIVYDADGTIRAIATASPTASPTAPWADHLFKAGESQVLFRPAARRAGGGNHMLAGLIRQARLYDRACRRSKSPLPPAFRAVGPDDIPPRLSAEQTRPSQPSCSRDRERLAMERHTLAELSQAQGLRRRSAQPPPTRLLIRGNVTAPGEVVAPGNASLPSRSACRPRH